MPEKTDGDAEAACLAKGGDWTPFATLRSDITHLSEDDLKRSICVITAPDAGNACTDSSQCQIGCLAPEGTRGGAETAGTCASHNWGAPSRLWVDQAHASFPSSDPGMFPAKERMLKELSENRVKWESLGLGDYTIRIEKSCWCLFGPAYGPNKIEVARSELQRATYLDESRDGFRSGQVLKPGVGTQYTINTLFEMLERRIGLTTGNALWEIEYNDTYGFPERIKFDRPDMFDEEYEIRVSDFSPG